MSIYSIISVAMLGVCTGIFNGLLAAGGYASPSVTDGMTVAFEQSQRVKDTITFCFVGLETITGLLLAVLLIFLSVEKNIQKEQNEIKERNSR